MTFTRATALLAVLGLAACKGLEPKPKADVTITISPTEAEIAVGETQFFVTTVEGSDDESVTWSVSNESVASVVDGLVTGLAAGTVDVTATSDADPEKSATATVTVTQNATTLTSGTPVTVSGASGSSKYFVINVPSGASQLVVTSIGGTGDADLYVRRGSLPTTSASDCDSESASSDESCVISSPTAGEWYVLLYGYTSYSNVELTATVGGSTATPGFTIASASSTATVAPGASTTVTVNATRTGGFTGSIALTATGLPTGVTASFNPATLTSSQTSSTLTLSAASNATAGTSTVTIRGNSSGQAEGTATVSLTVGSGGGSSQSISGYVSSDAIVVGRGQYTWFTVGTTTTSSSSISSAVTIEGLPAGVTVEWRSSMDVTPSTDAPTVYSNDYAKTARLVASAGAAPGAATITVRMTPFTAGVAPATQTIEVTVVDPGAAGNPAWEQLDFGSRPCGRRADGKTWCWGGLNTSGTGTPGNSAWVPAVAAMGREFSDVSVGHVHSCGIESGAAWCWGDPSMGKFGDGGMAQHGRFPVAVSGGLTWATIGSGASSSCALTTAGKVYCWGSQLGGALGDGVIAQTNGDYRTSPNEVNGGHTFAGLSVGKNHACALTAAGAAYCWGLNNYGEVGDGTRTTQASPVAVGGGIAFAKIVAGNNITCGLTASGAGYCWGLSRYVGDASINTSLGSNTYTLAPRVIPGGHTFADISIGEDHACAVTTSGAAYCWGDNFYGELGNGTSGTSSFSQGLSAVSGGHSFTQIEAGQDFSCGVTTTNELYCWGRNSYGTLGDGNSSGDKTTPTKVLTF